MHTNNNEEQETLISVSDTSNTREATAEQRRLLAEAFVLPYRNETDDSERDASELYTEALDRIHEAEELPAHVLDEKWKKQLDYPLRLHQRAFSRAADPFFYQCYGAAVRSLEDYQRQFTNLTSAIDQKIKQFDTPFHNALMINSFTVGIIGLIYFNFCKFDCQ